jgi:superfamily II DNA helicase RecQ
MLRDVPFIALTATATPAVRKDIILSHGLIDPVVTGTHLKKIFINYQKCIFKL